MTRAKALARLFGSVARDEAGPDSDLDLLVDFDPVPGLRFFAIGEEVGALDAATARLLAAG
jgi:uncharacterized protein